MQISYEGTDQQLRAAANYVNLLDEREDFWELVRARPSFTHTRLSPSEIERRLRIAAPTMMVQVWKPGFFQQLFYRKTVAFADARHPHVLFYHRKYLRNSVAQMVNTFVHEYIHDIDHHADGDPMINMGHGDNRASGKQDSAPYWIGDQAEKLYLAETNSDDAPKGAPAHVEGKASDGQTVE